MTSNILAHIAKHGLKYSRSRIDQIVGHSLEDESFSVEDASGIMTLTVSFGSLTLDKSNDRYVIEERIPHYLRIPIVVASSRRSHHRVVQIRQNDSLKRSGWLIPLSSIAEWDRVQNEYPTNPHLKRYVEAALWSLLFDETTFGFSNYSGNVDQDEFSLEELYPLDTAVLVLLKNKVPDDMLEQDDLTSSAKAEIIAQMVTYGYSVHPNRNPSRFLAEYDWNISEARRNINLERLSEDVKPHTEVICGLIDEAVQSTNPVVTFFLLYQVVEGLSSLVFESMRETVVEELTGTEGPHEYLAVVRTLQDKPRGTLTSSGGILRHLFESYCIGTTKKKRKDLEKASKAFLDAIRFKSKHTHVFGQTYAVRNKVIHSQAEWIGKPNVRPLLSEVNRCFLLMIIDTLKKVTIAEGKEAVSKAWYKS